MLDSLKQAGKNIGRELGRAWENLSEGWRELLTRSSNALTHFSLNNKNEAQPEIGTLATFPRWSLLAGEVEETGNEIVVRVEVPHRHHQQGKQYNVRIDIGVPGSEIVVNRDHAEDVYVALRDAFDAAKRRLEDYAHKIRCDVKTHRPKPTLESAEEIEQEDEADEQ